jgi:hypothetical protein
MDHDFDFAFALLDEAAERLGHQQYGTQRIACHDWKPLTLTTSHSYTAEDGHRLILLATDAYGLVAAIEATAPDLETEPQTRVVKVRAGELTFHGTPGTWEFRTRDANDTYTLSAGLGAGPAWTLVTGRGFAAAGDSIGDVLATIAGVPV